MKIGRRRVSFASGDESVSPKRVGPPWTAAGGVLQIILHAGPNGGGHFDCWHHSVNSPPPPSAIINAAIISEHNYERVCSINFMLMLHTCLRPKSVMVSDVRRGTTDHGHPDRPPY
eukprot:392238-Pleurochrysis_carterae.AAC.1